MDEYLLRRSNLAEQMCNESIAIVPGAELQSRNSDTEYPFRQNSDFYYLTAFCEPYALMALCKDNKGVVTFILFNQASDPAAEVWTGKRAGQGGACKIYKANESYDIATIDEVMPSLFANKQTIYYPLGVDDDFDLKILKWLKSSKSNLSRKNIANTTVAFIPNTLIDVLPLIHELRLFKSEQEIADMRRAAEISAHGHIKLMQLCKAGQMEYQLEAMFNAHCLHSGCRSLAYGSIVAGGNNGCTLHYVANDQVLKDGDLVLVDAGGEYNYYASDITRTFPVSGKFTQEQKQIYNIVLQAQLAGIEQIKPGNTVNQVQDAILEVIVRGLLELGILKGNVKQLISSQEYKKYYMHSSGHWLGLDTHDVGRYKINNQWRKFKPGMVLTVEPGIYIANDTLNINQKWLGIGVRIEDDVLVTKKGYEVLSHHAPKQIEEIESAML